jgi:hypothetical protein
MNERSGDLLGAGEGLEVLSGMAAYPHRACGEDCLRASSTADVVGREVDFVLALKLIRYHLLSSARSS